MKMSFDNMGQLRLDDLVLKNGTRQGTILTPSDTYKLYNYLISNLDIFTEPACFAQRERSSKGEQNEN